jgi:C4-type Zn-finger protein
VTEFEGLQDEELTSAEFYSAIKGGDVVEVEGVKQADKSILALEVELEKNGTTKKVKLEGTIDSFESPEQFTVNGHSVITDFKTRFEDGSPDDLAEGVHIEIKGIQGNSLVILAKRIEFETENERDVELEGEVEDFISVTAFSVGGQMVTTDDETEFEHGSAQNLASGVVVEIEGILMDTGVVLASKVEFEEIGEVSLAGPIENFVSVTEFMVSTQAITTNGNTEYEDGSPSMLSNGVFVEIEGVLNDVNVLLASEIEFEEPEEMKVEGKIENFNSTTDFVVDGQTITTDEFTEFKDGTAEDLAESTLVEVEGFLNSEQVLIANKVEFEELEADDENDDDDDEDENDGSERVG